MTLSLSLNRILVALLVSFIAVLGYVASAELLHLPLWACLWIFGFLLLALNASVSVS